MQVIDMLWDDIWLLGIYERPLRTCNPAHEFWSGSLAPPQALPERPRPPALAWNQAQFGLAPATHCLSPRRLEL